MEKRIRVFYWSGGVQRKGVATTYKGAMRIAARNSNAYDPMFYTWGGEPLINAHGCLFTEAELRRQAREPNTPVDMYA